MFNFFVHQISKSIAFLSIHPLLSKACILDPQDAQQIAERQDIKKKATPKDGLKDFLEVLPKE